MRIPGIDVPFHSPLLVAGVPAFRDVLEACIPKDVDIDRLVDRYVPNLVARPFELSEDFIDEMIAATGYQHLETFKKNPRKHGRKILIELLAWQFASPVRWIETQEYLADSVEQLVEIGPGSAPVLCNMFLSSTRHRERIPMVLHAARDFDTVLGMGAEEAEPEPAVEEPAAPVAQAPVAAAVQPTVSNVIAATAGPIEDQEWDVGAALKAILALRVGRPIDGIAQSETIDGLLGGNSARRNQLLLDIGKEYSIGAVDGAHELPLGELVEALERAGGARYRHPGAILKAAQTQALGTLGVTKKTVMSRLSADFGLETGRAEAVLSTLGVELDTHSKDGDPVKSAASAYARREGISLERSAGTTSAAVSVDAGAL